MITNESDISLALAVWLLHDEYDAISAENYISATSLMKPLRTIILGPRMKKQEVNVDVADFIPRALGNSIHDSVEKAWKKGNARSLRLLGYPEDVIARIRVNPSDDEMRASNSIIPIYLEQRAFREHMSYTIGGKFDMVADGMVQDFKSTSAFSWVKGTKDEDYILQGSLYRWIDAAQPYPKITDDILRINFIFTDWQKAQAKQNPTYPQKRVEHKDYVLMSLKQTEEWVSDKLSSIQKYKDVPENALPECTDDELWRSEPVYKYYADPTKTARSTKNFASAVEARAFMAERGGVGIVKEIPGEPKRCAYCDVFNICTQRRKYFND
jgi:hypothetical protein